MRVSVLAPPAHAGQRDNKPAAAVMINETTHAGGTGWASRRWARAIRLSTSTARHFGMLRESRDQIVMQHAAFM